MLGRILVRTRHQLRTEHAEHAETPDGDGRRPGR
jgi:hypothetical protein